MRRRLFGSVLVAALCLGTTSSCSGASAAQQGSSRPRITTYPVDTTQPGMILFGEGKVWSLQGDDLRPFDLGKEPLAGTIEQSSPDGNPVFAAGSLWLLRLDLEDECSPSVYRYLLMQIDPTFSSVTRSISIPACRYVNDNRSPRPILVGGGGAVWITFVDQIVRVDTATGSVTTTELSVPVTAVPPGVTRVVIASDEKGAWVTARGYTQHPPRFDNNLNYLVSGPTTLERIDHTGNVVASDLLPTARYLGRTYAAGAGGLFVSYAKPPSRRTKKWTLELARVTPDGRRIVVDPISPWSVATGNGQVWFLGTQNAERTAAAPTPPRQILGRIDPRTGDVVRVIRLHLPPSPPSQGVPVPKPRIVSVMDGEVWIGEIFLSRLRQHQLVRVAT